MTTRFTFEQEPHGSGGFARVIKGRDNVLERDIAVKVLNPLATQFQEADRERFRREARILAKLSHPNIPAIYDVDFGDGRFLIVFQFIEGQNLKEMIDEEGPCPLSEARVWFHQIVSALDHAHALGIIHRDIKPANIIITLDRESAYLVDFGIALTAADAKKLTKSGFVTGTPGYMSPEQVGGDEVDHRTDIYSLAVTLYEALAGKPIPIGQYEDLSATNEAIPPQIDELVRDGLAPKERRVDSAKMFGSRLAGALRPLKPLSEVLAHGHLHELANPIEELSPQEFAKLPEGQRALILAKVADITSSGDPKLAFASEEFLDLLLARAILLDKEDYREVVKPAIRWGFVQKLADERFGRPAIRRALEQAAYAARGGSHEVLREEFADFLREFAVDDKPDWYLHSVRQVIQTLLANPSCTKGATELVTALKKVNAVQRSKAAQRPLL